MMAGDEEIGVAVATVACCTSFVYKLENIRLQAVRLVPFTGTKFPQRNKTWKKKTPGFFFIPLNKKRTQADSLWLVDPGWMPGANQSGSITPLLSWTAERKI